MSRTKRLALALERLGRDVPDLGKRIDVARVQDGEPEELLVAAARLEATPYELSAEGHAELALLFLAAGAWARAQRHAEEVVVPGVASADVEARGHALLGRLAEVGGDRPAAIPHYRQAVELHPDSWRHQLDLATLLVELADDDAGLDEAAEALTAAAALAGETSWVSLVRAQLMLRHGEQAAAARTLAGLVAEATDPVAASAARLLATIDRGKANAEQD